MRPTYSIVYMAGLLGIDFGATGMAYDVAIVPVDCEECGKPSAHKIRKLEHTEKVECPHCGAEIRVSSPNWRERISSAALASKKVRVL